MLSKLAIDWRGSQPKLVNYLGRIEVQGVWSAVITTPDEGSATVNHDAVFWLGVAAGRGAGLCRFVRQVGQA